MATKPSADGDESREPAYGWAIVSLAALGMVATLPGRTHGLGMITERLLADPRLALDRVEYGHMNFWATLLGALFCLTCGPLVDRFGSRRVMTGVVLLLGLTVLGMCRATGWWTFFALLLLTRGLGQSALSVVSLTLVGKWFRSRLSVAMALFSVQVSLGFMLAFGVYRGLHGWSWTGVWASMGWILILCAAPLAWLLVRDAPHALSQQGAFAPPTADGSDGRSPRPSAPARFGCSAWQPRYTDWWPLARRCLPKRFWPSGNSPARRSMKSG